MSRNFDGSTSVIGIVNSATLRPALPITIAAWIKLDTLKVCGIFTSNKTDTNHRGAWLGLSDTSGHIEASFGDGAGTASSDRESKVTSGAAAVATGAWYHVAATIRGGGDMTIYINGADAGGAYSGTGNVQGYSTLVSGRIGTYAGGNFIDGLLAEIGFWSASLSTAEVLALAKGVPPLMIRYGSLIAHYPIYGASDPEVDWSGSHLNPTSLTAVTLANHAPVGCPFPVAV